MLKHFQTILLAILASVYFTYGYSVIKELQRKINETNIKTDKYNKDIDNLKRIEKEKERVFENVKGNMTLLIEKHGIQKEFAYILKNLILAKLGNNRSHSKEDISAKEYVADVKNNRKLNLTITLLKEEINILKRRRQSGVEEQCNQFSLNEEKKLNLPHIGELARKHEKTSLKLSLRNAATNLNEAKQRFEELMSRIEELERVKGNVTNLINPIVIKYKNNLQLAKDDLKKYQDENNKLKININKIKNDKRIEFRKGIDFLYELRDLRDDYGEYRKAKMCYKNLIEPKTNINIGA